MFKVLLINLLVLAAFGRAFAAKPVEGKVVAYNKISQDPEQDPGQDPVPTPQDPGQDPGQDPVPTPQDPGQDPGQDPDQEEFDF